MDAASNPRHHTKSICLSIVLATVLACQLGSAMLTTWRGFHHPPPWQLRLTSEQIRIAVHLGQYSGVLEQVRDAVPSGAYLACETSKEARDFNMSLRQLLYPCLVLSMDKLRSRLRRRDLDPQRRVYFLDLTGSTSLDARTDFVIRQRSDRHSLYEYQGVR